MKIGEVASRAGVPVRTIRFWEAERLLPGPARTPAGYRDYDEGAVERLAFIRQAQSAGFMIEQIRQVLDITDSGDRPCRHVCDLIDHRLEEVRARIAELEAARTRLELLARRAAGQDPADCQGICSIISSQAATTVRAPAELRPAATLNPGSAPSGRPRRRAARRTPR